MNLAEAYEDLQAENEQLRVWLVGLFQDCEGCWQEAEKALTDAGLLGQEETG